MRLERRPPGGEVDALIVGAGVAGLYLAYRIASERPDLSVLVLESSDRIGGRLRSVCRGDGQVLECGAAFISNAHANVFGLARTLKCSLIKTDFRRGAMYLRGRRDQSAYALAAHEQNQSGAELVLAALKQLAPTIDLHDADRPGGVLASERLRDVTVDGRPLWTWPIGALLRRVLSDEAYAFARATHGSTAAFGAANAFDTLVTQAFEAAPGQTFFQFTDGFESLALALAQAMPKVRAAMRHKVVSVRRRAGRFIVRAATGEAVTEISARQVFVALPQTALRRVRFSPDLAQAWCASDLNAVSPVKAFKLFLEFSEPWWRVQAGPLGRGDISATFTDSPLQQIYFQNAQGARPTIMAAFADGHGAEYWTSLRSEADQTDIVASASPAMLAAAMRELRRIYPSAPRPVSGFFADWTRLGAWHEWKPGVKSWEVSARMRQPNLEFPLFICGEAFSHAQGWTEGALNNAEAALERALGLCGPPWLHGPSPVPMKGNEHASRQFLGSPG